VAHMQLIVGCVANGFFNKHFVARASSMLIALLLGNYFMKPIVNSPSPSLTLFFSPSFSSLNHSFSQPPLILFLLPLHDRMKIRLTNIKKELREG